MGAASGDGAPVGRARNARRKGARKLKTTVEHIE